MDLKQINISIPLKLYKKVENYVELYGYEDVQEFILESLRNRVFARKNNGFKNMNNLNDLQDASLNSNKDAFDSEDDDSLTYVAEQVKREMKDRGFDDKS